MKNLYCIVGPSGSGKTTLAEALKAKYGYTVISSYTSRPPRFEGETGHIFVSSENFKTLNDVYAYNQYNGYEYGVTAKQLEENDLYVVEPSGVEDLFRRYRGHKGIKVIGLNPGVDVLIERMKLRGDSDDKIIDRLIEDADTFKNFHNIIDIAFTPELSVDELCEAVHSHIENFEYWAKHEFSLLNEREEDVYYGRETRFYSLDEFKERLKQNYPEGLPAGWTMRDDTATVTEGYIKDIHKCRPSFKTSMIRVDESTIERSSVGYTAVKFYYKDKTYIYRKPLNEDAWIDEYVRPISTKSAVEVLRDTLSFLYKQRGYIKKNIEEGYWDSNTSLVEDSKRRMNQMKNAVGYLKNALIKLKQDKHIDNAPFLDDVIKKATEYKVQQTDTIDKEHYKNLNFEENRDIYH